MSTRQSGPFDSVARKWFALAQRRKAAFIEMRESGRWRHYYVTPAAFDNRMREVNLTCDRWARLAENLPQEIDRAFDRDFDAVAVGSKLQLAKLDAAVLAVGPGRRR